MYDIFSWQKHQWSYLSALRDQDRLPHALLLNGAKDIGKRTFAFAFAHYLLCSNPHGAACGVCSECCLLTAETHPDLHIIEPVDKAKVIKIDQIRELVEVLNQTPQRGRAQVVIIHPLETLNVSSANALLKTLEEPQGNVFFILVSHRMKKVPPTVRSRCQRLDFSIPARVEGLKWLKTQHLDENIAPGKLLRLAEGLPLRALALGQGELFVHREKSVTHFLDLRLSRLSPLEAAGELMQTDIELLYVALLSVVMDMIRLKLSHAEQMMINIDYHEKLHAASVSLSATSLFKFIDQLLLFRQRSDSSAHFNQQLLLENLFVQWVYLS